MVGNWDSVGDVGKTLFVTTGVHFFPLPLLPDSAAPLMPPKL